MHKDEQYNQILKQAENDSDILGLALTGGRGKGFVTENSDYDICIVVSDDKIKEAKEKYKSTITPNKFDIAVHTMKSFRDYAVWGSEFAWDRYNFRYMKAQIDRTGEFQKIIDEKSTIPEDKIEQIIKYNLDEYINFFYRAMKKHRDGNDFAFLLAVSESVISLLKFVFSLEGRIRPFNKYVEWELEKHPLKFLPWKGDVFVSMITKILKTGDVKLQKEIFKKICQVANEKGYGKTIDAWEGCYFGD